MPILFLNDLKLILLSPDMYQPGRYVGFSLIMITTGYVSQTTTSIAPFIITPGQPEIQAGKCV